MDKTIEQVKKEMQGFHQWDFRKWYSYLHELTEDVRKEAFKMMQNEEIY